MIFRMIDRLKVLELLIDEGKLSNLRAIDLSYTVNLNFETVFSLLRRHGRQLRGISYAGNAKITEQFWINAIKHMKNIRYFSYLPIHVMTTSCFVLKNSGDGYSTWLVQENQYTYSYRSNPRSLRTRMSKIGTIRNSMG